MKIFGNHDDATIQQLWRCAAVGNVAGTVLCADGHKGYSQPVGGVVAYDGMVSPSGVGYDIGCGNMAVRLDLTYNDISHRIPQIGRDISKKVNFGLGGMNNRKAADHPLFDDTEAWIRADVEPLRGMAMEQLGTVGSGNHYVDLFRDRLDDHVWVGVHFGSRGLGHKSATKYLKLGGYVDDMDSAPVVFDVKSEIGERYLAAMELAGRYAYAGREWVVDTIVRMLCAKVTLTVHNHHNYAWLEEHDGKQLWVVRKGATPAFPGQLGFVGGSMGDDAVILEGVESQDSRESFYSTVHGAGRICGRMEAKGKKNKAGEWTRPPRFTREQMDAWLQRRGVYLIGGDVDESPMVYRRLDEVLKEHRGTVRVLHKLEPFLVLMAGNDVFDPYKD